MRNRSFVLALGIFSAIILCGFVLYAMKGPESHSPFEFFHTKEKIGHTTWSFMHTMLANLECGGDDKLTSEVRERAVRLIRSVQQNFPCPTCRHDFGELLQTYPPDNIETKTGLNEWLCKLHNLVNIKLKKPVFNCDILESKYKMRSGS